MACCATRWTPSRPTIPVILDAKRGDIGSTAAAYAACLLRQSWRRRRHAQPLPGARQHPALPCLRKTRGCFCSAAPPIPVRAIFRSSRSAIGDTLDREANQPLYIHVARTAVSWSPQHRPRRRRDLPGIPGRGALRRSRCLVAGSRHRCPGRRSVMPPLTPV